MKNMKRWGANTLAVLCIRVEEVKRQERDPMGKRPFYTAQGLVTYIVLDIIYVRGVKTSSLDCALCPRKFRDGVTYDRCPCRRLGSAPQEPTNIG